MRRNWRWMAAIGMPLLLLGGMPALGYGAEAEQKAEPPVKSEKSEEATTATPETPKAPKSEEKAVAVKRPAGLVGKIVAITPKSRTIVADVPHGKETLRIGAEIGDRTKIAMGGKTASFESLKEGEQVRISYHRTRTGDAATSVEVLRASKG